MRRQKPMTEKAKIIKHFKTSATLTCAQAIHNLGVYNLRSRASEMHLISNMITVKKVNGSEAQVAEYRMP